MKDDLLPYYEYELNFIRHLGKEFARNYGKIAGRLLLEPDKCEDPHVERLIEAFALLAGRIHHKIDDEFPEVTEALLNIHYPHYLRPIPPMTIAQFALDREQSNITTGHPIPAHTPLHSRAVPAGSCSFRTCYPVTLWPLEVTSASVVPAAAAGSAPVADRAFAAIQIRMSCHANATPAKLGLNNLRFFLNGEGSVVHTLYELLFVSAFRVTVYGTDDAGRMVESILPEPCLHQVGFGRDEGVLPYSDRSFLGYRLLQEYFVFPQKFLFFDLAGFDRIDLGKFGKEFNILISLQSFERKARLQQLTQAVRKETFQIGCTPAVNLFQRSAEPVRLSHARTEYRVVPDVHRPNATEIFSVDSVMSTAPYLEKAKRFSPFYSLAHSYEAEPGQAFWYAARRRSERPADAGTEVYLTLVDLGFKPALPPVETLTVHVTCSNRDFASQLPFAAEWGELNTESGSMTRVRMLMAPTRTVRPPLRRGLQWRLISHLALNHLSITNSEALQEILRLYDFSDDPIIRRQIAGIASVDAQPHFAPVVSEQGVAFVQGTNVDIRFDEDEFVGAGVFLLAAVLERFLGLYSGINSFSRLNATTKQRKEALKRWPPRSGQQIVL